MGLYHLIHVTPIYGFNLLVQYAQKDIFPLLIFTMLSYCVAYGYLAEFWIKNRYKVIFFYLFPICNFRRAYKQNEFSWNSIAYLIYYIGQVNKTNANEFKITCTVFCFSVRVCYAKRNEKISVREIPELRFCKWGEVYSRGKASEEE